MTVRVLVVDDHPVVRGGVVGWLEAQPDIDVVAEAADGLEALAAVAEHAPDVVLMDLRMPRMDGVELLKRLRAQDIDMPVLMVTAFGDVSSAVKAMRAGAEDYLTKPVDTRLLLRTLEELTGAADGAAEPRETAAVVASSGRSPAEAPVPIAGGPARPALDLAKLASLAALDRGDRFMDGLIADFVADLGTLVDELEQASADGNVRAFRDQAQASPSGRLAAPLTAPVSSLVPRWRRACCSQASKKIPQAWACSVALTVITSTLSSAS